MFLAIGVSMNVLGFFMTLGNNVLVSMYALVLFNSIWHIFCGAIFSKHILILCIEAQLYNTGMSCFLCLIVYMTNLAQEVGRKLYKKGMEDPLFGFTYGHSFLAILVRRTVPIV